MSAERERTRALFQTIGLLGKHEDPRVADTMRALARDLAGRRRRVLMHPAAVAELDGLPVQAADEPAMAARADLIVAIGGDGTLLYAARIVAGHNVPLLGVNRGRLGFLADVTPETMLERIAEVLDGHFIRESRLLLETQLERATGAGERSVALNDVVLQRGDSGRLLDFETWIDGAYVNTHSGDGIIVATATGSTAYALSCGGPIVQPELDALVLAPICPHTLSDRPLVVRGGTVIEIRLLARPDTVARVSCDGRPLGELGPGDTLRVAPAAQRITMIHPPDYDYYRILRSKLHWGRGSFPRPSEGSDP